MEQYPDEYYKQLVDGAAPKNDQRASADDVMLEIATGRCATAKRWSNKRLTFGEFKQQLQCPIRKRETMDEYALMGKVEQSRIKDVGGFVGGPSLDGERKKESIATRTLITADLDDATPELLERPEAFIHFAAAMYSTHSHMPEAPRVRLVAPMSRTVTAGEYETIARQLARDIGEAMFDPCSYNPNQMMFWPSCPADCEYYFREIDGPILDVDALIARSEAATAPEKHLTGNQRPATLTAEALHARGVMPQDPRTKDGVIGAFCRAYTVSAGISAYLAGLYEYAGSDGPGRTRYTWAQGEGARGLIVYDDLFAYSHHGTDPAADGHAQNIFDLVCIHRFGGDTKAAVRNFGKDPAVMRELDAERAKDFRAEGDLKDESAGDWRLKLERGERGDIKPTVTNCVAILAHDTRFAGFAANTLAGAVEVIGTLPWSRPHEARFWREADRAQLIAALDGLYAHFGGKTVDIAFAVAADNRRFNPLVEWFKTLPAWDDVPRVDALLPLYLGAEQSPYTAAVMRKTLLAAVARVYKPAAKFDYVPVLDGPQGIGKSTFWRLLAGDDYFTDALTLGDMDGKAGAEKIQGYWFAELAELAGMSKGDIRKMRSFITRANDDYRAAYARVSERRPRVTILVGTVNGERGYLRDLEGNRRFWPVVCKGAPEGAKAVWATLKRDRDQIWAEVLAMYNSLCHDPAALGSALQMDTPELRAAAEKAQNAAIEADDRETLVEAYLDTPILKPEEWAQLSIEERARFVRGRYYDDTGRDLSRLPRVQRDRVCLMEIYIECLGGTAERYSKQEQRTLAQLMKRLAPKWVKSGRRGDFGPYGFRGVEYTRAPTSSAAPETTGTDEVYIPF